MYLKCSTWIPYPWFAEEIKCQNSFLGRKLILFIKWCNSGPKWYRGKYHLDLLQITIGSDSTVKLTPKVICYATHFLKNKRLEFASPQNHIPFRQNKILGFISPQFNMPFQCQPTKCLLLWVEWLLCRRYPYDLSISYRALISSLKFLGSRWTGYAYSTENSSSSSVVTYTCQNSCLGCDKAGAALSFTLAATHLTQPFSISGLGTYRKTTHGKFYA